MEFPVPLVVEDDDYTRSMELRRVVDGDTVEVVVDLGYDIFHRTRVRLRWVDAQEMDTQEGKDWKKFVQQWFVSHSGDKLHIRTFEYKVDKYHRYLGEIFAVAKNGTTVCLNNDLVAAGMPRSKYQ